MTDEPLDRPRRGIAERADRMPLDLLGHVEQHVDLALLRAPDDHALHDAPHPARPFAAGRALAAAFVTVEIGDARNRLHDVGRLVHDDDRCRAEARLEVSKAVEVHRRVDDLVSRHQRHRGAAGDDRQEVVPSAADAAAMAVDQLAERDRHRLLEGAGALDVARDAEELGAGVVLAAEAGEPARPAPQDRRRHGDRLDVVHGRRAAVEADIGRERRLQARLALLALEALEQRRFLAADIGAGAVVDDDVEVPPALVAGAQEPRIVAFVDCRLERLALADVFAADVDVGVVGAHREAGDDAALDQRMRIVAHDVAVLAGARLRLVGVDDEVVRPAIALLRHEGPLQAGREARATPPAQARRLHLRDDPVAALFDETLGPVPVAAFHRTLQRPVVNAVDVGEDPILVSKHGVIRSLSIQPSARKFAEDLDVFGLAALGQGLGLLDPFLALDAAVEIELRVQPVALGLLEVGDLPPCPDAEPVELLLDLRSDAGNRLEVVGLIRPFHRRGAAGVGRAGALGALRDLHGGVGTVDSSSPPSALSARNATWRFPRHPWSGSSAPGRRRFP